MHFAKSGGRYAGVIAATILLSACQTAGPGKPDYSAFEGWKAITPEESHVYFAGPAKPKVTEVKRLWADGNERQELIKVLIGPEEEKSVVTVLLPPVAYSREAVDKYTSGQSILERAGEVCAHAYINQIAESVNSNGSFNYIPCYAKKLCVYASQKLGKMNDQQNGIIYRAVADFILCSKSMTVEEILPYTGSVRFRY